MSLQYSKKLPSFTESLLPYLQTKESATNNITFNSTNSTLLTVSSSSGPVIEDNKNYDISQDIANAGFLHILEDEGVNFEESVQLSDYRQNEKIKRDMLDDKDDRYRLRNSLYAADISTSFGVIDNLHIYNDAHQIEGSNDESFLDIMRLCQEDFEDRNSPSLQNNNFVSNLDDPDNEWVKRGVKTSIDPIKEYDHVLARRIAEELGVCDNKTTFNSSSFPDGTGKKNAWGRLSYADLIGRAIESSPKKRLTLAQIYEWMVRYVPYFKDKGDKKSSVGWKNSVRHNLSLHEQFVRIRENDTSKTSWWTLNLNVRSSSSSSHMHSSGQSNNQAIKSSNSRKRRKKTLSSMLGKIQSTDKSSKSKKLNSCDVSHAPRDHRSSFVTFDSNDQLFTQQLISSDDMNTKSNLHDDIIQQNNLTVLNGTKPFSGLENSLFSHCMENTVDNSSSYAQRIDSIGDGNVNQQDMCRRSTMNTFDFDGEIINSNDTTNMLNFSSHQNQQQEEEQIENASLLLSAACSLIARQREDKQLCTVLNPSSDSSKDESVFLLQLANGQLCRVLPNGGIDYSNLQGITDDSIYTRHFLNDNSFQVMSNLSSSEHDSGILQLSTLTPDSSYQLADHFEINDCALKQQAFLNQQSLLTMQTNDGKLSTDLNDMDFNDIHTFR